jgi:excisionase family DNA binding protein
MTDAQFERLLDIRETAQVLRLHPDTVKKMAERGQVPAIKLGKYWRFRLSELDVWIRSKTVSLQPEWNRRVTRRLAPQRRSAYADGLQNNSERRDGP